MFEETVYMFQMASFPFAFFSFAQGSIWTSYVKIATAEIMFVAMDPFVSGVLCATTCSCHEK